MPYSIGMNNASHSACPLCPLMDCGYCHAHMPQGTALYSVKVTSDGHTATCTVVRYPASGKARTLAYVREATPVLALREGRRAVRMARHCGGL